MIAIENYGNGMRGRYTVGARDARCCIPNNEGEDWTRNRIEPPLRGGILTKRPIKNVLPFYYYTYTTLLSFVAEHK